jgi:ketosteroid isomerase-like protein
VSERDVETVRAVIDAFQEGFEKGDAGVAWDTGLLAEDAEWRPAAEIPGPRSYVGREGFVDFMKGWEELFESWTFEVEEAIDAGGGRVVVYVKQAATGRGSGAQVDMRYASIYEVEYGRIVRISNFLERDHALRAAGLASDGD